MADKDKIDYQVVLGRTTSILENGVSDLLNQGYILAGSMSRDSTYLYQPVIYYPRISDMK